MDRPAFSYATDFPIYCLAFTKQGRILAGGGGGDNKSGIKNKLALYDIDLDEGRLEEAAVLDLNPNEDAPMCLSLNNENNVFACGINAAEDNKQDNNNNNNNNNNNCRVFELTEEDTENSSCSIKLLKTQSTVSSTKDTDDDYLKAIRFSKDGRRIACGSSSGGLSILSYPSLEPIYPHRHGEQDILDLDIDTEDDKMAVICGKELSFWSLASGRQLETLDSPKLNNAIECQFRACRFGRGESIGAIFVIINSIDRKHSTVCKLHTISYRKIAQEGIGRCPTTAFTISDNGRWLAFASADLSVGVVDAHTLQVVRHVAQVHNFAITSLAFSPDARLLVSGSAAASCHVMPLPVHMKKARNMDPLWVILIVIGLVSYFVVKYPELLTELTKYHGQALLSSSSSAANPISSPSVDTTWFKAEEDL